MNIYPKSPISHLHLIYSIYQEQIEGATKTKFCTVASSVSSISLFEKRTIKKSHRCDSFLWSGRRDSNSRQSAWKADTLPTELLPHILAKGYCKLYNVDSTLNKTNFQVPYCGNSLVAPSNAGAGTSISVVSSGAVCAYSLTLNVDNKIFLSLSYGLTSKSLILM